MGTETLYGQIAAPAGTECMLLEYTGSAGSDSRRTCFRVLDSSGTSSGAGVATSGGTAGSPAPATNGTSGSTASSGRGCSQWSIAGTWQVSQSNNHSPVLSLQQSGTSITGMVTLSADDQAKDNYVSNSGTLTGTLNGDQLQFVTNQAAKRDGSASQAQYTRTVLRGKISSGTAKDLLHPGSTATWTATGPAACAGSNASATSSTDRCPGA